MRAIYLPTLWFLLMLTAVACSAHTGNSAVQSANRDPLPATGGKALFMRGKRLAEQGDHVRAEQYYIAAMSNGFPRDKTLHFLLHSCIAASRLHSALRHARPSLEENPTNWKLRQLVGQLWVAVGEYDQARGEFERVIQDAPTQPLAHYSIGVLYRDRLNDPAQAVMHFQKYVKLAPTGRHVEEAKSSALILKRQRPTKVKS